MCSKYTECFDQLEQITDFSGGALKRQYLKQASCLSVCMAALQQWVKLDQYVVWTLKLCKRTWKSGKNSSDIIADLFLYNYSSYSFTMIFEK